MEHLEDIKKDLEEAINYTKTEVYFGENEYDFLETSENKKEYARDFVQAFESDMEFYGLTQEEAFEIVVKLLEER